MAEEGNPQNQERGFPSSLENAKSAFPTFPPLRLLLFQRDREKQKQNPDFDWFLAGWRDSELGQRGVTRIAGLEGFD
jgi:hypothetical protein